jgi:hypothetical protein
MHTYQSSFVFNLIIFIFYLLLIKKLSKKINLFIHVGVDWYSSHSRILNEKIIICGINGKEIDLYMFC